VLVQQFDFFEQRLQNFPQIRVQSRGQLPAHLLRATLGQPLARSIIFSIALADQLHLLRVRHEHLVLQLP
jgi:hypothetical protein